MWDNTLFVFASDNGGATDMGSDNGPLRGTKGDMYEGGIVTPAFLHFGADTVDVRVSLVRKSRHTGHCPL